jgi:uncharacterized protein YbbC (DUF1343 family)
LPGVKFRPVAFTPTFDKFKGQSCNGAMIHVTDRGAFKPLLTSIAIFQACRELSNGEFRWREDAYEFVEDVPAFDLLCGTDQVRKGIEAGWPLSRLTEGFDAQTAAFQKKREKFLLYE